MPTEPAKIETVKAAIQNASQHAQSTVAKTEEAAVAAVVRAEDMLASVKAGFASAKAVGAEMIDVVDNAGRATIGGVVTLNSSLVNYGKDVVNDTIEVGKKTLEVKSVADFVDLHTAYAERRINALFHTMGALNTIAQNNALAVFSPFAAMVRGFSAKSVDAAKVQNGFFKNAA
jgi:hypothetical protein